MSDLKDCPFCPNGRGEITFVQGHAEPKQYFGRCSACGACGPAFWDDPEQARKATILWNTRPREQALLEALEATVLLVDEIKKAFGGKPEINAPKSMAFLETVRDVIKQYRGE